MSYKVHYFNARGRAEPIRLVLVAANQKFEDIRIEQADWPKVKPTAPTGVLPFVETPEKNILIQSGAISRYLAKKYDLFGKGECEYYAVEKTLFQLSDIFQELSKLFFVPDAQFENAKKEFIEGKAKGLTTDLVKFLAESKTGFFAGATPTVADLTAICLVDTLQKLAPEFLSDFKELSDHHTKVLAALPKVAEWIQSRPDTKL